MIDASTVLFAAKAAPLFLTGTHFWYGVFLALSIVVLFRQFAWKFLSKWWTNRRNFMWFIVGREEIPNVAPAIPPASKRLGDVETELKEQHEDIKAQGSEQRSQGADIQEMKE